MFRKIWVLLAAVVVAVPNLAQTAESEGASEKAQPKSKLQTLTEGADKSDGLFTVYHKDQKILVDLKNNQLNQNFVVLTSIARGISSGMVLGGMSWNFGDDAIWSFRKVGEKIHVLRRNVRFKAKPGTPEADAVKLAYSDSVLYSLPILTKTSGGQLVDVTRIFLSDDQQIGRSIGIGFRFQSDRSTVAKVKSYPKNTELQIAAVYSGSRDLETVADSRGAQVYVHYSISKLPANGYKPRKADDRVGYFLTVLKNFSDDSDPQHFVRYINRWDLQKADPKASLSPPKEPIVFYLEKTVPINLRPTVRSAIEEWNKAFEKLGFSHAIEVRQQRDEDEWDPEDVRYNTFRWITAEAGFAMGPSRVNPMTGQILDADIIFDASFLRYWKQDYETFTPEDVAALQHPALQAQERVPFTTPGHVHGRKCALCRGMQQQMGFAAAALTVRGVASASGELPEEFIHQGLKEVVMHEVGHTLGLRHNFKASAWKSLEELADPENADEPIVASVMDYSPPNITGTGDEQGAYYTTTIGPYDYWAIEYGYKPISGDESKELAKIASKSGAPGLDYATDEDTRSVDSDPLSNRFDLGSDPLAYAKRQMAVAGELIPQVVERTVNDGEGYQRARQAFGMLLREYWRTAGFAARIPGGVYVHRDHKGDEHARTPFVVVDAEQQREAMKLLAETALGSPEYDPELLNHLASTRWSHWGLRSSTRLDYAIHDVIEQNQTQIVARLLDSLTLARLQDSELKVADDEDAYTLAEHLRLVVESVFTEWRKPAPGDYDNRAPYVASFRRNLQRATLKQLANLVTRGTAYPEDARTLARMHLTDLARHAESLLKKKNVKLDDYSRAHLLDSRDRIRQVLEAELNVSSIN